MDLIYSGLRLARSKQEGRGNAEQTSGLPGRASAQATSSAAAGRPLGESLPREDTERRLDVNL
jgi:hypothetical protein